MSSVKRPYFAHQVNMYDEETTKASSTPTLEKSAVSLIADYFGIPRTFDATLGAGVENPNEPEHQIGYKEAAKNRTSLADTKHGGMDYFYNFIEKCDACVCMGYLDGRIGLGVAGEAKNLLNAGKQGFMIEAARPFTVDLSRLEHFKRDHRTGVFFVRPFTQEEIDMILAFDMKHIPNEADPSREKMPWEKLVIPHLETRLRTWNVYNVKPMRLYEIAHLVEMPLPTDFYPDQKK